MEIPFFDESGKLAFERIVLYPYPDLKRIWTRVWLTAVIDQRPNIEVTILDPDGRENTSVFLMSHAETRADSTLHLRHPLPGETYHVIAELTLGLSESAELVERQEFDLLLEFRNPDRGEPGFGYGVDWEELRRKSQGEPD